MFVSLTDPLFQEAIPVLGQIESHGHEAYFVGGCVRDTLLNKKINDIDIASSARPEEVEAMFPITFDVGKEHGTIVVVVDKAPYEITTFRTEGDYTDFRRPDEVNFVRNLREDTLRRDFTINAMAFDRQGELYDYHGGLKDLNDHLIRCVGNAQERFLEDALRMMRAIRFASQLGFEIEEESFKAIQTLKANLQHISIERIRIEFSKFLLGNSFADKAQLLVNTGLADYLPGFTQALAKIVMTELSKDFENISNNLRDERLVWARMLKHMGIIQPETIRSFLKEWTHSNAFIKDVIQMIQLFDYFKEELVTSWEVYNYDYLNVQLVEDFLFETQFLDHKFVADIYNALPIKSKKDIAVNGKDVMTILNLKKGGPEIGAWLDKIERLIIEMELENTYSMIETYIKNRGSID
ncbi:MAG: CCA tRNA nucleotidyltransferase [Ruoffia tabacinasalis]|uniref:CCA tRNA nucleotidyltransferase n=1 Tax=Ruoffia sp. FAM 20857 TaxID=3259515 RepID=UPI000EC6E433|nr:CCA tRNA nucleotidyltransferase [Aerococcaceae bacterium]